MNVWFLLLSMLAHSGPCEMITSDHITGADLARALPAFARIPGDAVIGVSAMPGTRRVFTPAELEGIAKKYDIASPEKPKACFEWAMLPLKADAVRDAVRVRPRDAVPRGGHD